ncbi:MAG TPA: hypothetical protein ENN19_06510 [Chloroflexi bacterium]|nr:hypothetical protein [Chloroflexota bacterium]
MKRLTWLIAVGVGCMLLFGVIVSRADPASAPRTINSGQHFLPPYPSDRDRFGFDSEKSPPLTEFDVARLNAGWYSDWGYSANPAHPDHLTYVQLIRFSAGSCSSPYTDPAEVKVSPSKATMAQIATAQPGSLWMLSNEPDSCYQGNPVLPEIYAHVYHEYYHYIKSVDPTAVIANGGIVQPTPCRMMYLDVVLDTYQQAYGEPMPVDVWNIHAFALREVWDSWGASTPPGVPRSCGIDYKIRDADDIDIFRDNLIAFRQWMKGRGEQDKPLIISEYGILWPDWLSDEDGRKFTPARVSAFMIETFDLFLGETYPEIGLPQDNGRLVQAWAWYSLSEDSQYNGYLFHSKTKAISAMGQAYADYTAALPADDLYVDLSISPHVTLDVTPLQNIVLGEPYETTAVTLPVSAWVTNLGKLAADGVTIESCVTALTAGSVKLPCAQQILSVPARYEAEPIPFLAASVVLTQSGLYDLDVTIEMDADPENAFDDQRAWNDHVTATVNAAFDARPDLAITDVWWQFDLPTMQNGALDVALRVGNEGIWPTSDVSGTLYLSDTRGSLLVPAQRFTVPALLYGEQTTIDVDSLPLYVADDFYHLTLEVDDDAILDEVSEENNRVDLLIPAIVTATLYPESGVVITSTSGDVTLDVSAGTVTTTTVIYLIPRLVSQVAPDYLGGLSAFGLMAYQNGQMATAPFSRSITLTWRYNADNISGVMSEEGLKLYHETETDGVWEAVACPGTCLHPDKDELTSPLYDVGEYLLGQWIYKLRLPVIFREAQ